MADFADQIHETIAVYFDKVNAEIERAYEQALVGGEHGVLVIYRADHALIGVHPSVPYGEIHKRDEQWH